VVSTIRICELVIESSRARSITHLQVDTLRYMPVDDGLAGGYLPLLIVSEDESGISQWDGRGGRHGGVS
jgi:hypothetical protein